MPRRLPPFVVGETILRSNGTPSGLTFIAELPPRQQPSGQMDRRVKVRCRCGEETVLDVRNVRSGHSTSCGCERRRITIERETTHGEARIGSVTPLYRSWLRMMARTSPDSYAQNMKPNYVGVNRDQRWNDYEAFRDDVSEWWFPGASLGRMRREPDGSWVYDDGDYALGNVCWIEPGENSRQMLSRRWGNTYTPPPDVIARWEAMTANAKQEPRDTNV